MNGHISWPKYHHSQVTNNSSRGIDKASLVRDNDIHLLVSEEVDFKEEYWTII